jgi:hypothetical protein
MQRSTNVVETTGTEGSDNPGFIPWTSGNHSVMQGVNALTPN